MKKKYIVGGVILIGLSAFFLIRKPSNLLTQKDFEMSVVKKGRVVQEVTATGKIQPINTISVGTQISGIVEKVLVDYNDEVTEGQLLAELDTALLTENYNDAKASVDVAKAKEYQQELNFKRYEKLYKEKLIAKAVLEEAEVNLASAKATLLSAEAALNKAKQNLEYARITAPVSGTIIAKGVEQGQTVAASFSTPTLFTLAEDLDKMQIEASIAEADIGMIVSEMPVSFTVDAYPNDTFFGNVKQIRLSPKEEQNVVMYTVVIEADNKDRKLLPGMTAFVNIKIKEANDVLTVPLMSLQFKPSTAVKQMIKGNKTFDLKPNQVLVYQFEKDHIVPKVIEKGLSDMQSVEVVSGLSEGEKIISEAKNTRRKK